MFLSLSLSLGKVNERPLEPRSYIMQRAEGEREHVYMWRPNREEKKKEKKGGKSSLREREDSRFTGTARGS